MTHLFLLEMLLVFGVVLCWAWYEYRTADRLSKENKKKQSEEKDKG